MATALTGYRDVDEAANFPPFFLRQPSLRNASIHEQSRPPGISRKQVLILTACSCFSIFMHMGINTIPLILPIEIVRKEIPYEYCGAIVSIFALSIVIFEPLQAKIIPWVGTRNGFCLAALVSGLCYISLAMVDFADTVAGFVAPAMIIRFIEGISYSVLVTSANVIVCLAFPDHASLGFSILEGFVGAGYTLGPLFGGALFKYFGFRPPFLLIGWCLLVTSVLGYFVLDQVVGLKLSVREKERKRLLRDTAFVGCAVLTMAAGTVWGIFETALEPYLSTYNTSALTEGLVFAIAFLAYATMSPFWGFVFRKVHIDYRWVLVGPIVVALLWMILGPIPALSFIGKKLWLDTVCLFLIYSAIAYILVFSFDTMLKQALFYGMQEDVVTYALVVTGFFTALYIGEVVGPIIGGYLMAHYSFQEVAVCTATILFIAAGVAAIIMLINWNQLWKRFKRRLDEKYPQWMTPSEEASATGESSPLHSSMEETDSEKNIFQPTTPATETGALSLRDGRKSYGSIH